MTDPYTTPEANLAIHEEKTMEYASRWQRLGGALLDGIISGLPTAGIFYTLGMYDRMGPDGKFSGTDLILSLVIGIIVFLLINVYLMYTQGQTVGKKIVGTWVVTLSGEQVTGNTYLFLRMMPIWILTQIPVIGGIVAFVDTVLIFRSENNCLHDDIAKTRVVVA